MKILAIETSCDETSLTFLDASGGVRAPQFKVFQNLVYSQINIHRPFGGVVPNLAKREHEKNLPVLFKKLCPHPEKEKIDCVTVTVGPGLEPALWTGITFAQAIYKKLKTINPKLILVGANHLEGHLYSFLLAQKSAPRTSYFPAISLIVSGGHTILLKMDSFTKWKKLGETMDDAVGEAFDKVARMLRLPYPGGPEVERLAKQGNGEGIAFPRPMIHTKNYNFSFSGLKTAVLYYIRDNPRASYADIAASFQEAACEVLIKKTIRAAETYGARSIMLSGGVAANTALRTRFAYETKKIDAQFFAPPMEYNTDNAAMIGVT